MKVLVFSDSHGNCRNIEKVLLMHPDASAVIHLGDGERDMLKVADLLEGKTVVQVCGNCDFCSSLPFNELVRLNGTLVFCSHGHTELVKHGDGALRQKAKTAGARIALYGHTHQSVTDYDDGFYVMNPGSIGGYSPTFGIIDIASSGIFCTVAHL